ncbi:MAG: efflux RND transporter periplasmic adaptor subunit [Bacteroidetes bacterium]|nr:efflux RND transporter periplasmic adaptor subunit [Bacteroidota bacterium]MCB0843078.1 efflux RND transporter periplasmic adaptor subunit [Bacteroidota bacterium]
MKNIIIHITTLLTISILLMNCGNKASEPIEIGDNAPAEMGDSDFIEITDKQFELAKMKLGQLVDYNFASHIRSTGMIEVPVKNHTQVSAYAGGYVRFIDLIPGEKVRKGQLLFTLENPEFVQMQQDYLEAKAQLAYLQSDYERQKTLAGENIASQKKFLKAESDYQVTLAQMEGLKKRLSMMGISAEKLVPEKLSSSISIYAPVTGHITSINAMKGMFLNPTDVAIELVNTDHMHLELNVFEKDILKVKEGQKIRFRIPDASTEVFNAEVHLIGKEVVGENRVVRVHGHLEENKNAPDFVPGMFVEADIITDEYASKGLPEQAIVEVDNQSFVLVSKGKKEGINQFEKIKVITGPREKGFVQILNSDDFSAGQTVLVEGAFHLIQGE